MARITEEQIQEINEVYYRTKNKSQTAREVGVSVASVNKYLIPNFVPAAQRITYTFDKEPTGSYRWIQELLKAENPIKEFCAGYELSEDEWTDLKSLQEEI